jgi:hypothetical protein
MIAIVATTTMAIERMISTALAMSHQPASYMGSGPK